MTLLLKIMILMITIDQVYFLSREL